MQQFGYVQTIPPHPTAPSLFIEDIDDRLILFFEYLAPIGHICVAPRKCAANYIKWFCFTSHPFMSPTQPEDPPRNSPVVHDDTFIEPDPP